MSDSFAVGDVVQLKSGSEKMTIEEIDGNDISCVWFVGNTPHRQTFVSVAIKKYNPPSGGGGLRRG